jgi:hypothetical protein
MRSGIVVVTAALLILGCRVEPLKITRTKTSVSNGLTFNYMVENVRGWDVIIKDTLWLERPKLIREVLGMLDESLSRISGSLPSQALERLRAIPIYVTDTKSSRGGSVHVHNSAGWLIANGEDEQKVLAVDVCDPEQLDEDLKHHRWLVLNDLSLAYQGKFLTSEDKIKLASLHQKALASGKYGILPFADQMRKSWASTSPPAYFAETSVAYWARNVAFPFDRHDLLDYDPDILDFLARVWTRLEE